MRAIAYTSYGGPRVTKIIDAQRPTPEPQQVLIRTVAVGLNPVDAAQRKGLVRLIHPHTFPKIGGNEVSGVVEAVGPEVRGFAVGDRVFARTGTTQQEALADFVAVDQSLVAAAPRSVPLEDAAAVPLAGLTAQQALDKDHLDLQPGDRLLITGGAGGVGLLAIQLAKSMGAHVTTTASSAGLELVRAVGADHVINYRERKISEGGERFTKALDLIGGRTVSDLMGSMERGGAVVTAAGPPTPGSIDADLPRIKGMIARPLLKLISLTVRRRAQRAGVSFEFFLMHPDGAGLEHLSRLIDDGGMRVVVDSRHPVAQYATAFERMESHRAKGKVLVVFS